MSSRLECDQVGLLVIDAQERLVDAMPRKVAERNVRQISVVVAGAHALEIPVLVSEQYPSGLGPTVEPVLGATEGLQVMEKTTFSCWEDEGLKSAIETTGRETWLLCGMETHVCVYQTARSLVEAGKRVQVLSDACLSRRRHHFEGGLELCRVAGAEISNVESALFDLVGGKNHPHFKTISKLVR